MAPSRCRSPSAAPTTAWSTGLSKRSFRPMHQRKTAAIRFTCPRVVSAAPALHDFLGALAPPYKTRHDPDSRRSDAVCALFRFDGIRFGLTARMADRAVPIELT